ncbi:MAG: RidA family protein [Pseudomonadota bacterium]|nr:RidA family protein [Pseudomonadota bacterium]
MLKNAIAAAALILVSIPVFAAGAQRSYIEPPGYDAKTSPPFSNGVMAGDTFYIAGHLGLDSATGQAAADPEMEAKLVMEAVQETLAKAGLTMDDLVSVTIYCTDLELYGKFNAVYRGYFHGHFPARAFIGVSKLVRGARFEIAGTAVKSKHR